jgi:hypothetical protein
MQINPSAQTSFKFGKYEVVYKHKKKHTIYADKTIEIKKDSTFHYLERFEWPSEITDGKWRIENYKLILNSLPDTVFYDPIKHFESERRIISRGLYIMFVHKSYVIKNKWLIEEEGQKNKYKFLNN